MPDITTKLGLKKPLVNEVVSRAAHNENLDILELMAAREQFVIKSLSYDGPNDRIIVTIGPGIAELFNSDAAITVSKVADTDYYITAPAINTTYYLYLQADGNFAHNTTGTIPAGALLLWYVATGAVLITITAIDQRLHLSVAGGKLAAHLADTGNPHYVTAAQAGAETPAGAQEKVDTHAAMDTAHGATAAATANKIALRDAKGQVVGFVPAARVKNSTAQSIANTTLTALSFDSEDFDTDIIHDLATNKSRLTCKTAGIYDIKATVAFANNATGYRRVSILLGGTDTVSEGFISAVNGNVTSIAIGSNYYLNVGEYVEVYVYQTSGGALDVHEGTKTTFSMIKEG